MWTITARLKICGYEMSEVDLTPVLGFAMIALVVVSLAANTFN
jgi:hypothetical protein